MARRKRVFWFLCIAVINIVIGLGLCEAVLRIFPQLFPASSDDEMLEFHPVLSVWHKPLLTTQYSGECYNAELSFNEFGLRSLPEADLRKRSDAWMFVGDSMVAGLQVDNAQLFSSLLQEQLDDIAMFNLGKSGSGPIIYNKVLKNFLEYEPVHENVTRIFYFIFLGNDFDNLLRESRDSPLKTFVKRVFYKVRVYHLLRILYFQLRYTLFERRMHAKPENSSQQPEQNGAVELKKTDRERNDERVLPEELPFYAYSNKMSEDAFGILDEVLAEFQMLARRHRSRAILVTLPSVKDIQRGLKDPAYLYPTEMLRRLSEEHQIEFYDMAADLMRYQAASQLEYPYYSLECDGHFSAFGHQALAQYLLKKYATNDN